MRHAIVAQGDQAMIIPYRGNPKLSLTRIPRDGHEQRSAWRHVAAELAEVAAGADTADVSIALRMVLSMEGVECRLQ
jgi:hypothetical protein